MMIFLYSIGGCFIGIVLLVVYSCLVVSSQFSRLEEERDAKRVPVELAS